MEQHTEVLGNNRARGGQTGPAPHNVADNPATTPRMEPLSTAASKLSYKFQRLR